MSLYFACHHLLVLCFVLFCFFEEKNFTSSEYWQNFKAEGVTSNLSPLGNPLKSSSESTPLFVLISSSVFISKFHYILSLCME